jgi:hydroxyacylglutathione hydrolase
VVVHPREADRVRAAGRTLTLVDAVDGRDLAIGRRGVRALETPGHTVGGTCYLADGYVITGDVLFVGGCGRTDFAGGDTAQMWNSLQRLARLPEETRVYPGHNYGDTETSTIAHELRSNRFLRCASLDEFRVLRERKRA